MGPRSEKVAADPKYGQGSSSGKCERRCLKQWNRHEKLRSHPMPRAIPVKVGHNAKHATSPMYTLDVFLISGPMTDKFVEKNPVVSRRIQMQSESARTRRIIPMTNKDNPVTDCPTPFSSISAFGVLSDNDCLPVPDSPCQRHRAVAADPVPPRLPK
jgi:hypothetical protein